MGRWASFFVAGALYPVLVNRPPDKQDEWLTDHRGSVIIEDAGHSVQQEEPEQVNAALLDFVESIDYRAGYGSGRERWVRSCGRGPAVSGPPKR